MKALGLEVADKTFCISKVYCLTPWPSYATNHSKIFRRVPPKDHFYEIWSKTSQRFQKRKCLSEFFYQCPWLQLTPQMPATFIYQYIPGWCDQWGCGLSWPPSASHGADVSCPGVGRHSPPSWLPGMTAAPHLMLGAASVSQAASDD